MKNIFVLLLVTYSLSAFARQYTQCSSEGLYSVVNLPTQTKGTLFLTPGAETDDRLLAQLEFNREENGHHVYTVLNAPFAGELFFPTAALNKNSNDVNVTLIAAGVTYDFSCFSRIYQD